MKYTILNLWKNKSVHVHFIEYLHQDISKNTSQLFKQTMKKPKYDRRFYEWSSETF